MRFEQENNISYMVMEYHSEVMQESKKENTGECGRMEYKMIQSNHVGGLLQFHSRQINGIDMYYYNITAKQQLSKLYTYLPIRWEDVEMICKGISLAVSELNRYMLDLEKVILDVDCIYMDAASKELYFAYYPCGSFCTVNENMPTGFQEGVKRLFEYILERFDHTACKEQLMQLYGIYQRVAQGDYDAERMDELIITQERDERPSPKQDDNAALDDSVTQQHKTENGMLVSEDMRQNDHHTSVKIQAIPPQILEDEEETLNQSAAAVQKAVKYIAVAAAFVSAAKLLFPQLLPLPFRPGVSLVIAVMAAILYFAVSRIPRYYFERLRIRRVEQPYELERNAQGKEERNEVLAGSGGPDEKEDKETVLLSEYLNRSDPAAVSLKLLARSDGMKDILVQTLPCLIGGMGERCNCIVKDALISRIHCCIVQDGETYYIEDLNSTNGTFVNGKRLAPNSRIPLKNKDEVQLAVHLYEVEIN